MWASKGTLHVRTPQKPAVDAPLPHAPPAAAFLGGISKLSTGYNTPSQDPVPVHQKQVPLKTREIRKNPWELGEPTGF